MVDQRTKEEKLAHLEVIIDGEERFFSDYSDDIRMYLQDEDPDVRALAVQALWDHSAPDNLDILLKLAQNDESQQVREAALSGLGIYIWQREVLLDDMEWGPAFPSLDEFEVSQAETQQAYDYLMQVIDDDARTFGERRHAIEAISFSMDSTVADIIEEAYHHEDDAMKASAVFAMGRNANVRWIDYVLDSLDSSEPEIQYEAVRAAGKMGLMRANRRLMKLARASDDKALRVEAIWSLGQIGHDDAFDLLEDLEVEDPDADIREMAGIALEEWMMMAEMSEYDEFDDDDWYYGEGMAHD